jgi:hypothetical protein
MTKLANRLPEEFVNSPDLQGMDFQDLFQDLEEIRKVDGRGLPAPRAAQRLMQALTPDDGLAWEGGIAGEYGRHGPDAGGERTAGGRRRQDPRGTAGGPQGDRKNRTRSGAEWRRDPQAAERELPHLRRQLEELARALPGTE